MAQRLIDKLCARHVEEALVDGRWSSGLAECRRCQPGTVLSLPDDDTQFAIATHEAAHAVTYEALGIEVIDVRIGEDLKGETNFLSGDIVPTGIMAGIAGVHRYVQFQRVVSDADLVDILATGWGDLMSLVEQPFDVVDLARQEANVIVADNWDWIMRVARELVDYGQVTGRVVRVLQ